MGNNSITGRGDLGYSFRTQQPRNIEDIDLLHRHLHQLKLDLGDERSTHVEENPEQYTDADKFRILHAKARFRTAVTLLAVYVAAPTFAAMNMAGYKSG